MVDSTYLAAIIDTVAAAENHIRTEYAGDWDATIETVHPDARYAVVARPGVLKVVQGKDDVATMYNGAHGVTIPQASRLVAQIVTDWYMFFENFPTRIDVASGAWRTSHSATLVPVAPPLIRGEMLWERPGPVDQPDSDPMAAARSLLLHERFLDALRSGDAAELDSLIDPAARWAERDYLAQDASTPILDLTGREAIDYCRRSQARFAPRRVSILNRIATSWYVFAEELWTGEPDPSAPMQFRRAVIYPITPEGRIGGTIGWGTDPEPATAAADVTLGAAFWEHRVPGIAPDPLLRGRAC